MRKPYLIFGWAILLITISLSCNKGSDNPSSNKAPEYDLIFLKTEVNNYTASGICRSSGPEDKFTIIKSLAFSNTFDSFFSDALTSPQFGPNNQIIFLATFKDFAEHKPYSMDMNGKIITRLTDVDEANYFSINVSPKSGRMVCEREVPSTDQYQLITCKADGSDVRIIKTLQYGKTNWGFGVANWFPDGETIIFSLQEGANTDSPMELYSIKWDGTGEKKLSNTKDRLYLHLNVSPDGKKILYTQRKGGHYNVYVVNTDMSNDRPVVMSNSSTISYINLNWHSDSRWFACSSLNSVIFIVDSDGDGSKTKVIAYSSRGGRIK